MNWNKTKASDDSKKNIEGLIQSFDKFIEENHKSEYSYD
jgi:hypothetical protein